MSLCSAHSYKLLVVTDREPLLRPFKGFSCDPVKVERALKLPLSPQCPFLAGVLRSHGISDQKWGTRSTGIPLQTSFYPQVSLL